VQDHPLHDKASEIFKPSEYFAHGNSALLYFLGSPDRKSLFAEPLDLCPAGLGEVLLLSKATTSDINSSIATSMPSLSGQATSLGVGSVGSFKVA
jgi:hypothetical protein